MKRTITYLLVFCPFFILAQPYAGIDGKKPSSPNLEKAAGCAPPSMTTLMEINNVRAMIHTAGNLWQIPGKNNSMYEVPKNSGIMALFTAALWLGGTDINNQLKLAALRYRDGQDYWTGPLTNEYAEISPDDCLKYDQHYVSQKDKIAEYSAWYEAGISDQQNGTNTQSTLFPNYKIPEIVKNWPAHGDVSKGQDYYLAPFYDYNKDGTYNYLDGDYPWYDLYNSKNCKTDKSVALFGDLNYWWVMNDKGNLHTESQADPIGMEIRAQAFCFNSNDEINNMTFMNYVLINRGTQTLYNSYFGFFTDGCLGNPTNDYVGCDVNRGLAYYYNGVAVDEDLAGYKGYGASPPAVGIDFFEGPYQDDDGIDNAFGIGLGEALNGIGYGDGIIDNERYGMRRFVYYSNTTNGANVNQTDPISASDYYNYLNGRWKDGSPCVYGGSGYISDPQANPNIKADFMFPGDTDPLGWGTGGIVQAPWTEQSAGNVPNDRRFVQSAGPFILKPGAVNNITVGVVWARSSAGDPFESVKTLKIADDKAQALFENCFKVLEGPHAPDLSIQELDNQLILYLNNPLNSNNYQEKYNEFDPFIFSSDSTIDRNYQFQGYQIFQVKNTSVSVSELNDNSKARLVAQCDIKDEYSRIINFEYDESIDASIPVEKVNGENKGIRHSFKITEDAFAIGEKNLINFKDYHFIAISYAVNNYKKYIPGDPLSIDGQKKIYLSSRKAAIGSIKVISAIPHKTEPENGGTLLQSFYGDQPEITKIDGYGNGGFEVELSEKSIKNILVNNHIDEVTYDKGKAPINIKVIDPLNVIDGYFELKFTNYVPSLGDANSTDTSSWIVYRYDKQNGVILDSIKSEKNISFDNEQLIPEWGISIQIHQNQYYGSIDILKQTTDPIMSTIEFVDSSKRWLSGIEDNSSFYPTNWIRSGSYKDTIKNYSLGWGNPYCYLDETSVDVNKLYSKAFAGLFAPHRLTGYQCNGMPLAYYQSSIPSNGYYESPGSTRTNCSISFLPGIDLVITNDESLWTRCPVFELCRDANLSIGNAKPGALRKNLSVGKDFKPDNSGTYGMSWFPGYAIDVETGTRLYIAFGENSSLNAENGFDMKWNPSNNIYDLNGYPVMGGQHAIYIYSYKLKTINKSSSLYDMGAYSEQNNEVYNLMQLVESGDFTAKRNLYNSLTWIGYPILNSKEQFLSTDVKIKIRLNKEYKSMHCTGRNNGLPMFGWSTSEIAVKTNQGNVGSNALDLIRIVPNPYYAYSEYERSKVDSRVKITNLPDVCTVRIYGINGKLLRTFKKDNKITYLEWDMNNQAGIQISSGIYIVHIQAKELGEKSVKFMCGNRQADLHGF